MEKILELMELMDDEQKKKLITLTEELLQLSESALFVQEMP